MLKVHINRSSPFITTGAKSPGLEKTYKAMCYEDTSKTLLMTTALATVDLYKQTFTTDEKKNAEITSVGGSPSAQTPGKNWRTVRAKRQHV